MKLLFTYILPLLIIVNLSAQDIALEWANSIGNSRWDVPTDIEVDDAGNVYTTGFYSDSVDFDPGPNVLNLIDIGILDVGVFGGSNAYVKKMDNNGNLIWAISNLSGDIDNSSGTINKISVDPNGNVYVLSGEANSTVDVDPGPATLYLNETGDFNVIQKFDPNGNLLWALPLNAGSLMKADSNGDVYISGTYPYGTIDIDPGAGVYDITNNISTSDCPFMAKLSGATGDLIWGANFASACTGSFVSKIDLDANGNILIGGYFKNIIDIDPGPNQNLLVGPDQNIRNGFIIRLDSSGNLTGVRSYINGGDVKTFGFDSNNNLYALVSGLDPSIFGINFGIVKYSSSWTTLWANEMVAASFYYDMLVTSEGNLYLYGRFSGTVDLDPDPNNTYNITTTNSNSTYLTRWDATGGYQNPPSMLWGLDMDYDFRHWNYMRLYMEDRPNNELYITGAIEGTVDVDYSIGTYNLTAPACSGTCPDIMTQKINTCPGSSNTTVQVDLCEGDSYTFPDGNTVNNIATSITDTYTFTHPNGCDSTIITNITVHSDYSAYEAFYVCQGTNVIFPDGTSQIANSDMTYTSYLTSVYGCDSTVLTDVFVDIAPTMTAYFNCDVNAIIFNVTDMGTYLGNPITSFDVVVGTQTTNIFAPGGYNISFQLGDISDESWQVDILHPNLCIPYLFIYPDCIDPTCGPDAEQLVYNSDFEAVAPAPVGWTQSVLYLDGSDTGFDIILNNFPYNGSALSAWLGGVTQGSTNTLEQTVSFPQSLGITELTWWEYQTGACEADDVITVSIDGNVIYTNTGANDPFCGDNKWHQRTIDISPYSDGSAHLLTFYYIQPSTNGYTSYFLDNVRVHSCPCSDSEVVNEIICSGDSYTFPDGTIQGNITSDITYISSLTNSQGCDSTIVTELVVNEPVVFTTYYDCATDIIHISVTDMGLVGNPASSSSFNMTIGNTTYSILAVGDYILPANPNQSWRFDIPDHSCTASQFLYTDDCLEQACSINNLESIANGDFEDATNTAWTTSSTYIDGSPRTFDIINTNYVYNYPNELKSAHLGADFNEYQGTISTISQDIVIPPGISTTLSWWQYERWACSPDDNLSMYMDGNLIYSANASQNSYCNAFVWSYQSVDLSAYSGDGLIHNFSIVYTQPNTNGTTRLHIDNISIETCPCEHSNTSVLESICSGDDYTFPDGTTQTNITEDLIQTSVVTNVAGCNDTTITELTVLPTNFGVISTNVCEGDDYTYADGAVSTNITANESQVTVLTNQYGCDSSFLELVTVQSYYNVEGDTWICEPLPYQKHIYVDDTATGTNTGDSWNNAFVDLQDALALAATETFYKIHVAEGTYYPTSGTQRGIAFEIPERTDLLGGYPNNGGTRDPALHETILSGNIDQTPDKNGNSYHVVSIKDVQIVTMDGFTIRDGNADNANSFGRSRGGGLYVKGSASIILENCDVKWNKALYGGGIFATLTSPLQLNNSQFTNNRANYGSAIFHSNETFLYLLNTRITNNRSDIRAAIEVNNSNYTRLINTVIANNETANSNAISLVATNRDQSCDIYNSTITGEEKNKYLISMLIGFGDQLDVNIYNSIIAHQDASFNKGFVAYQNGILNLNTDHCYLQGTSVLGTSNGNLYTGIDGPLVLNADYSLPSNSLGIDAGDDALIQYYTTDITGANRSLGAAVDMGAFEYQATGSREFETTIEEDAISNTIKVFPNPTKNQLNVQFDIHKDEIVYLQLFDTQGQLIQSGERSVSPLETIEMDVSGLASGVYFIHVNVNGETYSERIFILE